MTALNGSLGVATALRQPLLFMPPLQTEPPASAPRFKVTFLGLMLAVVVSSLDQNIVAVALPRIADELGGIGYISWTVTAFLLASTIAAPVYGKLSDMYGRRRLFAVSMLFFLVTSVLCSLAASMPQLIAARALQGLGAGGLVTLSQSAIGDLVGPQQRGRYQGYFSGALATSTVLGPLLGGALITGLSWRWIFIVTLPIGLAALALTRNGLQRAQLKKAHRIDYAGVILLALGTSAALLFVNSLEKNTGASPSFAVGSALTAAACVLLFIRQERRAPEPLLAPTLFGNGSFVVGVTAAGMMTFAMQGAMVFLPLYFQAVQGLTPTHSGLMLIAQIAGMILSSIIGGQISARSGQFKTFLVAGVTMEMLALATLTLLACIDAPPPAFLLALALLGLGTGLGMPNAVVIVQNAVDRSALGIATASMSFLRSLGSSLGVALSGCVMHFTLVTITGEARSALRLAIASSFGLGASMMLLALTAIALKLPAQQRR
jgi:EmrB/QacA subfamily drug resistance transporter